MSKKVIYITEEQLKFLEENKGVLFEYYGQVSKPKRDSHILGNIQIWIYGNDRQDFTPHCHVMYNDRSVEFEVSLLDWSIINVKRPSSTECDWSSFKAFKKPFFKWLNSTNAIGTTNKQQLYFAWDSDNPSNNLEMFVNEHQIEITDPDLQIYIES
jgi:hypothetical protein